jgi:hypothetical protein
MAFTFQIIEGSHYEVMSSGLKGFMEVSKRTKRQGLLSQEQLIQNSAHRAFGMPSVAFKISNVPDFRTWLYFGTANFMSIEETMTGGVVVDNHLVLDIRAFRKFILKFYFSKLATSIRKTFILLWLLKLHSAQHICFADYGLRLCEFTIGESHTDGGY